MKNRRLKQFVLSLCVVLSLFASSVSACACLHHQVKTEAEVPSCHQVSHISDQKDSAEKSKVQTTHQTAFDESCVCFVQNAPQVFGKSETLKIQKQSALFTTEIEIVDNFVLAHAPSATRFDFSKTSLSDSSYNIKSPRAPPRL